MIDIKKMLMSDEGYKLVVYRCTAGFLTGGIGHNFDADKALHIMNRHVSFGDKISPDEAIELFLYDYGRVMAGLNRRVVGIENFPQSYKAVLINMAFQMGVDGLLKFKKMLSAMAYLDDDAVIDSIKDSKYYTQTQKRAKRMIALIRGDVPREYA